MEKNYLRICLSVVNTVLMMVLMTFMSQSLQAQGNCLVANGGLGCSDPACEATVCAVDPFCCNTAWDGICATEAADLCGFGPQPVDPCNSVVNITCGSTENYSLAEGTGSWNSLGGPYSTPGNEQVFSFTAPTTGSYDIAVSSSSGWVDLFYKSGACSGTGWSYVDDIFTSGATNTISLIGGTTYLFLLDDENTAATTGTISVTCPITDPCSSVISLSCGSTENYSLAVGSGVWDNLGIYGTPGNEQVFSFTAPTTGFYDIAVSSSSGYVDLFYKSSACSGTGWSYVDDIYTSGATNTISLIGGTTYLFLLDDENTTATTGTISVTCPITDACSSVMNITCGGTANFSLAEGTGSWNSLGGPYSTPGHEQVFSFTAPTTGFYDISVTNNDYYIDLYYKSGACSSTGWTYVDDVYTSGATNTLSLIGGTTYLFLLDDENTTASSGTISVTCCDNAAEGPEVTSCPDGQELCGAQNVSWATPTATDNCVEPTVSSNYDSGDFFGVGTWNVEYIFADGTGKTATCAFTIVINPLPEIAINHNNVPEWCQGVKVLFAKVANVAALAEPLTFEWYQGNTYLGGGQELLATANGTYDVVVTDGNGCSATASTVVNYDLSTLLSAHTIIVDDQMDMDKSTVISGGVGVLDADEVTVQHSSNIMTFMRSATAIIDGSSTVANYINSDSPVNVPAFMANPYLDNNDQVITGNVTLSGTNYGNVYVKTGGTLTIGNGEMYMKSLTMAKGSTLKFNQEGSLKIRAKMNIGPMCNVNVEGPAVVVYVGDKASVGQGSIVWVDIYAPEGLKAGDSGAYLTTYMNGLFISDDLTSGDNVVWGWNLTCGDLDNGGGNGGGGDDCFDGPACDVTGPAGTAYGPCEDAICALDPFCCNNSWDSICVGEAEAEPACAPCLSTCGGGNGGGGDDCFDGPACDVTGPAGTAYGPCQDAICALDPFCCNNSWDGICVGEAEEEPACAPCLSTCGNDPLAQAITQPQAIEDEQVERAGGLVVYPNPSSGLVNIGVKDFMGQTLDVTITNGLGQRVWSQHFETLETSKISVDLSDGRYSSGIYQLSLYANGKLTTKQVVLSK